MILEKVFDIVYEILKPAGGPLLVFGGGQPETACQDDREKQEGEGLGAKPAPLFSSQDSARDERVDETTTPADETEPSTTTPETPDTSTTKPDDDTTEDDQDSSTATTPETPTDSDQDAADGGDQTTATTPGTGDGSTSGGDTTDGANAASA